MNLPPNSCVYMASKKFRALSAADSSSNKLAILQMALPPLPHPFKPRIALTSAAGAVQGSWASHRSCKSLRMMFFFSYLSDPLSSQQPYTAVLGSNLPARIGLGCCLVGFTFRVTTASLLRPWPRQQKPRHRVSVSASHSSA